MSIASGVAPRFTMIPVRHALVIVTVLLCLSVPSSAAGHVFPPLTGERYLCESNSPAMWWPMNPDISGSRVVFERWTGLYQGIVLYDLVADRTRDLTWHDLSRADYNTVDITPRVSGRRVVYERNGAIWFCDVVTGVETPLPREVGEAQRSPAISGSTIVYASNQSGGWDVCSYDVLTHVRARLSTDTSDEEEPVVFDTWAAYQSRESTSISLHALNLENGSRLRIASNATGGDFHADLWGSRVVYQDERAGNRDIYCYDVVTGLESRITSTPARQEEPSICGDKVVYQDWRDGGPEICCVDLATGVDRLLTTSGSSGHPSIAGSLVVYEDASGLSLFELKPPSTVSTPVAPSVFYRDKPREVFGSLSPTRAAGDGSVRICLWKRSADGLWHAAGYATAELADFSSHSRYAALLVFPSTGAWRVRACALGNDTHATTMSSGYDSVVVADVTVGTPDAPEVMRDDTPYAVSGYLGPRHPEGQTPVRVYRWKRQRDGTWDPRGYVLATVRDYSTYSRYRAYVRFSSPGEWRLRAYHPECPQHRARWSSGYDQVTVTW